MYVESLDPELHKGPNVDPVDLRPLPGPLSFRFSTQGKPRVTPTRRIL